MKHNISELVFDLLLHLMIKQYLTSLFDVDEARIWFLDVDDAKMLEELTVQSSASVVVMSG